ncbi:uncharacterized protein METZ01_LOCUS335072, partial [marine metagenome]
MAVRVPGANTPDELWSVLDRGLDRFTPVPADRWAHDEVRAKTGHIAKNICSTGAYLDDVFGFEPEAFEMSEASAKATEPQQRIFLEVAAEALSNAGVAAGSVGTFVSYGPDALRDDRSFLADIVHPGFTTDGHLDGTTNNMVAARVCRLFNLTGPAVVIQAACASSLVAIHQARRALQHDECEVALAGGVELIYSPTRYLLFAAGGVLSHSGKCTPFSTDAAGFVPGEGAAAVVLKRLDRALADGDRI